MRSRLGDQRGAKNRGWKGGRHTDARGYVTVVVAPEDEIGMAMVRMKLGHHRHGWNHIHEHRLVVAHALGRPLYPFEQVHHINGEKTDNRLENLKLFGSQSEHLKAIHLAICPHCGHPLR